MGRIVTQVEISNPFAERGEPLTCSMFVDTGAASVILPRAWKERLGEFRSEDAVELALADNRTIRGQACGPAAIHIEGFRKIWSEVLFSDMDKSQTGEYEPLLGYIALEQAQAAVDMLGHRLVPVKYIDCK